MNNEQKSGKKANHDILKWIIWVLIGIAIIVSAFGAGMFVGGAKARFSYRWAESYHENFAGPRGGFFGDWQKMPPPPGDFIGGHGVFGEIIELKDDGFVIKDHGDVEKMVTTTEETVIKKGMETVKDGLQVGDYVVIIGSPNDEGQVGAKLIRVFSQEEMEKGPSKSFRFPFFK